MFSCTASANYYMDKKLYLNCFHVHQNKLYNTPRNLYTPSNCVMTNKALNFSMLFYLCSSFKTSDDQSDSQLQYLPNLYFTLKGGYFVESIEPMILNSLEHKAKPLHAKLCLNF